jgi:myosin III
LLSLGPQYHIERYGVIKKGFEQLGFSADEWRSVQSIVAAIIHLGDLDFVEAASKDNTDKCRIANHDQVNTGNRLLLTR